MNYFSDFSVWWLFPCLIFSGGLSYWYYFKSHQQASWELKQRKLLALLRGTGLFLVLLLLIGLVWETVTYRKEKPLFITLVDESSSELNYSDSNHVETQIANFQKALNDRFGNQFEMVELSVGESVQPLGKLNLNRKQTNLASGFDHIREVYFNRNIGGIVLISDGNYNAGMHPMYEADRIPLTPIFTLGVGDTITRKDQLVKSIVSNEVAFLGNEFPIEGTIEFNKIPKGPVIVDLMNQGKRIASQKVICGNSNFDQQLVTFQVVAKSKGFQRYTLHVENNSGEVTFSNNQQSCYVEVIDNKNTIALVSSAPHPDLAAIRSVIEEDQETKIITDLTANFTIPKENPNLVIWYENGSKPNPTLFAALKARKIPIWLIIGPSTPPAVIQAYQIGLKLPNGTQQEDVYPSIFAGFSAFSLTEDVVSISKMFPPIRTKFGNYMYPPGMEVILNQRIGSISKKDPLLYVSMVDQTKMGVLLGEGIWRWKMKEFTIKHNIDGFRELVLKMIQYLTVKQNSEHLRVTLPKRFVVTEDIEVKAEFYNDAMELITSPELSFYYQKKGKSQQKIGFTAVSNFYKVNAGELSPGTYTWKVIAKDKGKVYSKIGEFVVEDIAIESLDTRSDFSVLNQLAIQSEGSFHPLRNYQDLLDELETRGDIATLQFADAGFTALIDWKWLFAFLILIFGTEWFLRRWWGGY
jgi:hypothetical protein